LAGEGGSASGVWTLADVLAGEKANIWPQPVLPRSLYAWGRNNWGQLAQNNLISRSSPVQVGALTDWAQVSESGIRVSAIKTNGTLWGWGAGGATGDGTAYNRSSPVQVGALTNWFQVSVGESGNAAAIKTDGTLWAWGENTWGQLGQNDRSVRRSPVQVGALTNWYLVSFGTDFWISVKTDGTLWACGINSTEGRLGTGDGISRSSPVQVGALTNWSKVFCGYRHTISVKTDGTLWAWGQNFGVLGNNSIANSTVPIQVGLLTNWSQPAAGGQTRSAATKTDGTLWAWGNAPVGDNTTINRSSPVQIGALTNWAQVALSGYFSASVKTDGTLWAWANNSHGQLGQNDLISRSSPVQVGSLTNWNQVSAGQYSAIAITKG
jgi:alpha-tubulin suppressor-like RCC1 family protein